MAATLACRTPIMAERAVDVAIVRHLDAISAGRRLGWAREAGGVSQSELAGFVGVSRRTIGRVEHGQRAMRGTERAAIARALGTSISMLMPATTSTGTVVAWETTC